MDTDKIDSISDTPTKKRDHPTSSPEDNVTTNIAKLREAVDKENATKKFKRNENEIETNKSLKNKTIKIIVSNHNIKPENITKNHINENCIKNFSVIDAKQSYVNKELLMCTILTCDINKSINKLNWKVGEQNLKITVDKKSNLLISLCVNKIFDQEGQELSLSITRIELTEISENIFNLRKQNNLFVFETFLEEKEAFDNLTITVLGSKHNVRPYDPLENYVEQCKKCFKFHSTFECKNKYLCAWCNKEKCFRKCNKETRKCTNCDGNHSSLYRGCKIYKKQLENASQKKNEQQKDTKIKNISLKTENLKNNINILQQSYASILKNQTESNKQQESVHMIEEKFKEMIKINEKITKDMDLIKNNIQKIVEVTTNTQKKIIELEKIHKEEIENITKKLNKKIDSTQLASILYETSYAIVTNKMCEPMSIASNIIQIIQRSVGNIEKEVLFNNLGKLAESSLIFSPPENTNDLSFLKNDN